MDATPEILKGNNPMKVEQIFGPDIKPYEVLEFESMLRYEDFQMFGESGFQKNGRVIITQGAGTARCDGWNCGTLWR